ncbi:DUF1036 domain-containing protein [Bartonella sp. B41]
MFYLKELHNRGDFVVAKKWCCIFRRLFIIFFFSIPFVFSLVNFAKADLRICNTTQQPVGVALGYRTLSGWVSEGWWVIPITECKTLIEGPLSSRFYYFYAEGAQKKGGWPGSVTMCVQDSQFTIKGVHDCFARGFQKAGFKEIDTGNQTSWMIQLTDVPSFGDSVLHSPTLSGVSSQ